MGLEAATYISQLVATNPVGATDPKSQGDDHLRLIKSALLSTFPNFTAAAMNATQAQLNVLATDGAGAGMLADIAAIADPNADRVLGWDDSANAAIAFSLSAPLRSVLTGIEIRDDIGVIADLAALTDPNADVFYGWDDSATALVGFTLISGELLTTGATVGVGANIPKLDAANVFTGLNVVNVAAGAQLDLRNSTTGPAYALFRTNGTSRGYVGFAGATNDLVTGAALGDLVLRSDAGGLKFTGNGGTTIHFALTSAGVVSSPGASASEVGKLGIPLNSQINLGGAYTLVATDNGKHVYLGGSTTGVTVPAGLPVGFSCMIFSNTGGNTNLTQSSTSLYMAGVAAGAAANRTMTDRAWVSLTAFAADTYVVSGVGVS